MPAVFTDPLFYCAAIPAVILLGLAKGGFSGIGTAATPLVALYLPPLESCSVAATDPSHPRHHFGLRLPEGLGCMESQGDAARRRGRHGHRLVSFASHLPDSAVRIIVGTIGLAFIINSWLKRANIDPQQKTAASGFVWGSVSGFTSFMMQEAHLPSRFMCYRSNSRR